MKISYPDPPIEKTFTIYRKWWQFWKPNEWEETHTYGTVIDLEGDTLPSEDRGRDGTIN